MTKKTSNRYSPEVRERAVRMVLEHGSDHASQWATTAGLTSNERERMKGMEREIRKLRQANEILRKASAYFAQAELDRQSKP